MRGSIIPGKVQTREPQETQPILSGQYCFSYISNPVLLLLVAV